MLNSSKWKAFGIWVIFIGISCLSLGLYYDSLIIVSLGLVCCAIGIGIYSISLLRKQHSPMQAMANLVFHEKIAIISNYLKKQQQQIDHDRCAALEFEDWAEPELKQEFHELWQEFYTQGTKPVVVKIGGSTLGSHDTTLRDLVILQQRGIPIVVVHGGGHRITEWLDRMNIPTKFVRGQRVTDEETMGVVAAVLTGLVNKELVAAINSAGGKAIGLSGIDGALIEGKIKSPDMGYTGEVVAVNPESIIAILNSGYIPVIAPAGFGSFSKYNDEVVLLNINADTSASEIAIALGADKLIFLTDVPGIKDSDGYLIPRLSATEAQSLIDTGVINGGMIPKVEACLHSLSSVSSTLIIDGRSNDALLSAINGNSEGTKIE